LAAQSAARAGKSKKKWAKSKLREKKNNRVVFTKALHDQVIAGAPKRKALTIYSLIETYKIGGACARKIVKNLLAAGSIKVVSKAGNMSVYTSAKDE